MNRGLVQGREAAVTRRSASVTRRTTAVTRGVSAAMNLELGNLYPTTTHVPPLKKGLVGPGMKRLRA